MKMFKASLTVEFPYDEINSPMALGAQIEAALTGGKEQIANEIVEKHANASAINVGLSASIVNVRPKKAPTPPVEPAADPNQVDLEEAIQEAGDEQGTQEPEAV